MNNNNNIGGQTTQIKSARCCVVSRLSTSRSIPFFRQNQHQHQQMENMNEQQRRVSFQSGRPPVVEGGARLAQLRAARKRAAQQKAQETSNNGQGEQRTLWDFLGNQTDQAGRNTKATSKSNPTFVDVFANGTVTETKRHRATSETETVRVGDESAGEFGESASGWRREEKKDRDGR